MSEQTAFHQAAPQASDARRRLPGILLAVGVVLISGLAGYLAFRGDLRRDRPGRLPASFEFKLQQQLAINPEWIRYRLADHIDLPPGEVRALASGPEDHIFVADAQSVYILNREGVLQSVVALSSGPTCLAIGGADHVEPGRMYVGTTGGIEVFDASGQPVASWPRPNAEAVVTSIAVAHRDVFLADAGNRVVWRYDPAGEQLGQIGLPDPARQVPGFVIPGGHFDVVVAAEDLLYVVNPGKLQVVAFTFAGEIGTAWGRADSSIRGFFGCCNPTHLAILPDGRFVTSEKGLPRIKVYSATGTLESVVAAPQHLGISPQSVGDPRLTPQHSAFDIATDSRGRVLVLDPPSRSIRIFVRKDAADVSGVRS